MSTQASHALTLIKENRPNLFVLDVDMNGSMPDGLACLREDCAAHPSLRTVVVCASDDPERIDATLGAGAVAYVLKRAEAGDLESAIRQVFTRSLYLAGAYQNRPSPVLEADTAG